jgi:prepilin-type N-terminal cleavage/methylation domain-containing protein
MFRLEPAINPVHRRHERGFSIIEITVVILIIAIAAAFMIPQAIAYMRMYRLGLGARNVSTAIQRARFLATSNNTRAGIHLPDAQHVQIEQYDPEGIKEPEAKGTIELPQGVMAADDGPRQIDFDGRGVVTPMPKESPTIRLNGPNGYYVFVIVSATGQVTVSETKSSDKR